MISMKERDVLALVAVGYSDKEIALEMKISYGTVRTYLNRAILKLQAKNKTHAITLYSLKNPHWLKKMK